MTSEEARRNLQGCYVTLPTMFADHDLSVDVSAMRRHVRFLIEAGIVAGAGVLLVGGAAGDFTTLTFDERSRIADAVADEAAGAVPVVMGAQTTSTRELVNLALVAERVGAEFIQVSPPYYFAHTDDDLYEFVRAVADETNVGIILYNTHWTSSPVAIELIDRLAELPSVVGLKWSMPDTGFMDFEQVVSRFSGGFCIIDNQLRFVTSHMLGVRAIETHVCNYWPEWGIKVWNLLESGRYVDAQEELVRVAMPFMMLWREMERFTGGDGYLDKLCMELVGLGSSRCRPPTRDVRLRFREQVLEMLLRCGVPRALQRIQGEDAVEELSAAE